MPEAVEPIATPLPRARKLLMSILAAIIAYPFLLGSGGYGISPLVFIVLASVVAIFGERALSRRARSRGSLTALRVGLLLLIGIGTLILGRLSSHADGPQTFERITGIKPPPGISLIGAWNQWYDGENWLIRFSCDEPDAVALATQMRIEKRYVERTSAERAAPDRIAIFLLMPFFDMSRVRLPIMQDPQYWESGRQSSNLEIENRKLLYDSGTRCGVLLMYKG